MFFVPRGSYEIQIKFAIRQYEKPSQQGLQRKIFWLLSVIFKLFPGKGSALLKYSPVTSHVLRDTQQQFSENICSEDDLRSRIWVTGRFDTKSFRYKYFRYKLKSIRYTGYIP